MKEDHIFFVEWSCANRRNKSVGTLSLGQWLCTKERINEKGPYHVTNL